MNLIKMNFVKAVTHTTICELFWMKLNYWQL